MGRNVALPPGAVDYLNGTSNRLRCSVGIKRLQETTRIHCATQVVFLWPHTQRRLQRTREERDTGNVLGNR